MLSVLVFIIGVILGRIWFGFILLPIIYGIPRTTWHVAHGLLRAPAIWVYVFPTVLWSVLLFLAVLVLRFLAPKRCRRPLRKLRRGNWAAPGHPSWLSPDGLSTGPKGLGQRLLGFNGKVSPEPKDAVGSCFQHIPCRQRPKRPELFETSTMLDEIFTRALAAFPDAANTISRIRDVRREAFSRPYEEFFEPKSAFDLSGKSPRLLGLSLPDVEAWASTWPTAPASACSHSSRQSWTPSSMIT